MRKTRRIDVDTRGVAIYARKSRITNKGTVSVFSSSSAQSMRKRSCDWMMTLPLWSMRIKV